MSRLYSIFTSDADATPAHAATTTRAIRPANRGRRRGRSWDFILGWIIAVPLLDRSGGWAYPSAREWLRTRPGSRIRPPTGYVAPWRGRRAGDRPIAGPRRSRGALGLP